MPIPVLLYPGVLLRRWYVPAKQPELMSDAAKQLVLLLWVCAGLVFVIGLMALAAAVSPVGNSGWIYLAFAFYHAAAFMLCFFHVLHADVYGFDVRLNTFWCGYNGALAVCYVIGTLGNVLWFPSKWGEHPEYENSVGGFGGGMGMGNETPAQLAARMLAQTKDPQAALMQSLAEGRQLKDVQAVFNSCPRKSARIHKAFLDACLEAGDIDAAQRVLEMAQQTMAADEESFTTLIQALCSAGKSQQACRVWDSMRSEGYQPGHALYAALVEAAAKHGEDMEDAWK